MFGKKYNKAVEKIEPNERSLADTAAAMKNAGKSKKNMVWKGAVALAACLALVLGTVAVLPLFNKPSTGGVNVSVPTVNGNIGSAVDNFFGKLFGNIFGGNSTENGSGFTTVKDYKTLSLTLSARYEEQKALYPNYSNGDETFDDAAEAGPEDVPTADGSDNKAPEYSDTNNQVTGVQEADIVKTDGSFIYAANQDKLKIFKANDGELTLCSTVGYSDPLYGVKLMLFGNRVVVIGSQYESPKDGWTIFTGDTVACVFEVDEKGGATQVHRHFQEGSFYSVRGIGESLYLITGKSFRVNYDDMDEAWITENLPAVGNEATIVAPEDVLVPDTVIEQSFTTVCGIDMTTFKTSSACIAGGGSGIYSDADTLYIYGTYGYYEDKDDWNSYTTKTDISRIELNNGIPEASGTCTLDGRVLNQYSIDEHNGYLRVALIRKEDNALCVLDKDLKLVGEVDGMGVNEQIKSVRYYGDIAYVVTFRQTDPLYAIDLSVPEKPTILSELKIPGFSTYLQGYGENKLFGFGTAADEDGRAYGLKLSMFDVTDYTNVTEENTLVLGSATITGDVLKAVGVYPDKGIIMFPYSDAEGYKAALYSYDENGFKLLGETLLIDESMHYYYGVDMRCLYIGDYVYVVTVISNDKAEGEKIKVMSFTIDNLTPVSQAE